MRRLLLITAMVLGSGCSDVQTKKASDKELDSKSTTTVATTFTIEAINSNPLKSEVPDVIYDIYRKKATPTADVVPSVNPPTMQWVRNGDHQARYTVELSQDQSFETNVISSDKIKWCFFNPHEKLQSGSWYWRYTTHIGNSKLQSEPHSFTINDNIRVYQYPSVKTLVANVPKQHPYLLTYGKPLKEVIENAKKLPEVSQKILTLGDKVLTEEIIDFATVNSGKYTKRQLFNLPNVERRKFYALVQAYLISGQDNYQDEAIRRLEQMMTQKVEGEMAVSHVMRSIAIAYDSLHSGLTAPLKQQIREKIKPYLESRYNKWSGKTENRQIENHFWQMELSALFDVALATIHELPENEKYLAYAYGIFMARSPVVGGNDGGWANGHGYFSVNGSTVIDMAYTLQKVGGLDVFGKPWYQGMPDYFLYTSPAGGTIDGFGDMHDRGNNDGRGGKLAFYIGVEKNDPKALYHAAQVMKRNGVLHSWFRLVNGVSFDVNNISDPGPLSQAKLFKEVGLAAMHTKVKTPEEDLALYFRSSPYGANGHMHANQNSFNISYKGKRVFYSTGYYTSFADPHSITSYKHTRASNSILINGKGQSYGHEGYGWIKRYLHGEQITYVNGDASMAYRPMVNKQWLSLANKQMTKPGKMPADNFASDQLKLTRFDRHIAFLRPDVFVIYDVLEAEENNDWSLLLHTYIESYKANDNQLILDQPDMYAQATLFSSEPAEMTVTDRFYEKPIDFKGKYKGMYPGVPNQFHMTYRSQGKSKKMRFLTFIQVHDSKAQVLPIEKISAGQFKIGDWTVKAELDTSKEASLIAGNMTAQLNVNTAAKSVLGKELPPVTPSASVLTELINGKVIHGLSTDQAPAIN